MYTGPGSFFHSKFVWQILLYRLFEPFGSVFFFLSFLGFLTEKRFNAITQAKPAGVGP